MYAEAAHRITCCRHHAARACAPDDQRCAFQLGVVPLLDRRVEGVHVDVQYGARIHRIGHFTVMVIFCDCSTGSKAWCR
jgi:hypothetical protein